MSTGGIITRIPLWGVYGFTLALTGVLCALDYATGTDFDFLIFYLIPLLIMTWWGGATTGYLFAVLGVALHTAVDRITVPVYTYPLFFYWNILEDIGILVLLVFALSRLKTALCQLKALNHRLACTNQELQDALRMKNEFLNMAAHDLKNPLTAIIGFSELLAQPGQQPSREEVTDDARTIMDGARRMLSLIKNLLDVNKYESRELTPVPAELDLVAITRHLVSQNVRQAADKNIIIHNDVKGEATAWADAMLTEQVLDNLISNAIKFSPPGRSIYLRNRTKDATVFWEVRDEGPGITSEDKAKLFQKFARLTARPTGGENSTGLGLSIVKTLVELMRGQVWCESEAGHGATFIVALPRRC